MSFGAYMGDAGASRTGGPHSPFGQKLQRLFETADDSATLQQALTAFAQSYRLGPEDQGIGAHEVPFSADWLGRQPQLLRPRLARQTLAWNRQYLDGFTRIYQNYLELAEEVEGLDADYVQLRDQWQTVSKKSALVNEQAEALMEQREITQRKRDMAQSFLNHHTLSADHESVVARTSQLVVSWDERFRGETHGQSLWQVHLAPLNGPFQNTNNRSVTSEFARWYAQLDTLVDSDRFFKVIDALQVIHASTQSLLSMKEQRVGNDVLKQLARSEEVVYQALYLWLRGQSELQLRTDEPKVTQRFRRALGEIKWKPALFTALMDTLVDMRREALVNAFLSMVMHGETGPTSPTSLSGSDPYGGPVRRGSGYARPLEFYAADPLRYVGDMVAWVHQAHASEREWLDNVLYGDGPERPVARSVLAETPISDLLSRIIEGLDDPFQLRVSQALHASHLDLLIAFHLFHLLHFYRHLIAKASSVRAPMALTLAHLSTEAKAVFFDLLHQYANRIIQEMDVPDRDDIDVVPAVQESMVQLERLVLIQEKSFMTTPITGEDATAVTEGNGGASATTSFEPELAGHLVNVIIDPIMVNCVELADNMDWNPRDRLIFLLNNECYAYVRLAQLTLVSGHLQNVRDRIQAYVSQLEIMGLKYLMERSGLSLIHDKIDTQSELTDDLLISFLKDFTAILQENELVDSLRDQLRSLTATLDRATLDSLITLQSNPESNLGSPILTSSSKRAPSYSSPHHQADSMVEQRVVLRNWILDQSIILFLEQYQSFTDHLQLIGCPDHLKSVLFSATDLHTLLI
ncbi:Golgi transport complex subunit 6 [Dimargaris cristalligena]|nr:Golgi transport complex subunit 6 [Dimargaris cristalligena]